MVTVVYAQGLPVFVLSVQGHSDGGKKLGEFLQWCMEAGVAMATAFAFSTENWKRDTHEVSDCMLSCFYVFTLPLRLGTNSKATRRTISKYSSVLVVRSFPLDCVFSCWL